MSREVSIGAFIGLNNRLPVTRLETSLANRSPATYFRVADNVELTASGLIRRRQGFALASAGGFHSLWADEQDAYAVKDGALLHIHPLTMAQTLAAPDVGAGRVSYARLPDGMVYWTNGRSIGRLSGAVARDAVTPAPNPTPIATATAGSLTPGRYQVCFTALSNDGESATTEPQEVLLPNGGGIAFAGLTPATLVYATGADGAVFNEIAPGDYLSPGNTGAVCSTFMLATMPAGSAIAHYRGSLLVARGKFLYLSEPYRYGLMNAGRGFIPFPKEITVIQPCEDGLYVCADKTYWIPGDPLSANPVVVQPFGALPGSAVFDPEEQTAYWQSRQGVVVAKPGGQTAAPQYAALTFASASSGATLVREQDGERHVIAARFDVAPI